MGVGTFNPPVPRVGHISWLKSEAEARWWLGVLMCSVFGILALKIRIISLTVLMFSLDILPMLKGLSIVITKIWPVFFLPFSFPPRVGLDFPTQKMHA